MSNPGNKRLQRARHGAAPSSSLVKKTVTTTVNGRTFTVTRQEGSVLNNAGNMKFGLFPTIGKSMPFLLKLVDCCDKGKDISFGVVTESHLESEPELECLIKENIVNVVKANGNKYIFNSTTYNSNKVYGLTKGKYVFKGVPENHAMALLNKGKEELISYTGDDDKKINREVQEISHGYNYDFYYGDLEVEVKGDFEKLSVYCYYHGYMGGEDLLKYSETCPLPEPVYTPLVNHVGKTRPQQMMITGNIYWAVNEWIEDPSQFKSGGAYEEYGPIEKWDTSQVTDMSYLIHPAGESQMLEVSLYTGEAGITHPTITNEEEFVAWVLKHDKFNEDLSQWDVSSVTDMSNMFSRDWAGDPLHARDIDVRVGDISGWDVSSVTNMSEMFGGLRYFNQDISGWDVSSVTNMSNMFYRATSFDQPLNGWDVSRVTDMTYMFSVAREFNQDLSGWDVSSVTDMMGMFSDATSFNQDLSGWDVARVTRMSGMFRDATAILTQYSSLPEDPVPADWNTYWS